MEEDGFRGNEAAIGVFRIVGYPFPSGTSEEPFSPCEIRLLMFADGGDSRRLRRYKDFQGGLISLMFTLKIHSWSVEAFGDPVSLDHL